MVSRRFEHDFWFFWFQPILLIVFLNFFLLIFFGFFSIFAISFLSPVHGIDDGIFIDDGKFAMLPCLNHRSPSNTDGWIPLVVAENKLSNELMLERLNKVQNVPKHVLNYGGMKGMESLQHAVVSLMQDTFVPEPELDPNCVCLLSGASAILDSMFFCIGDEGQSVLIPAPYYPAFDNDLSARAHLIPTPFSLMEGTSNEIHSQLDTVSKAAADAGHPVCALLISNPNNPLGIIYSPNTVKSMIQWCIKNEIHYVSDEIYALSCFKISCGTKVQDASLHKQHKKFISALTFCNEMIQEGSLDQEIADTYVHLVYGFSKDWSSSGLRVGVLYSKNSFLQAALNSLAPFAAISNHTQYLLAESLSDKSWRDEFIQKNAELLEKSYDTISSHLRKAEIPFQAAEAGMFVWIDLRKWLPSSTWEAEKVLWDRICQESKVILTPGEACHAPEPGFFRVCYAWMDAEALAEAIQRLSTLLTKSNK